MTKAKFSLFQGHTADKKIVGVVAVVGNPFLTVKVNGKKRSLEVEKMEVLLNMSKLTADQLMSKLL